MNVILQGVVSNPKSFSGFTYQDENGSWVTMDSEEYTNAIMELGLKIYNREFENEQSNKP